MPEAGVNVRILVFAPSTTVTGGLATADPFRVQDQVTVSPLTSLIFAVKARGKPTLTVDPVAAGD